MGAPMGNDNAKGKHQRGKKSGLNPKSKKRVKKLKQRNKVSGLRRRRFGTLSGGSFRKSGGSFSYD